MSSYVTPTKNLELPVSLPTVRRVCWLILALCVVVAICGVIWLGVLYMASLALLPDVYARLASSISEARDISVLKSACLTAMRLDEADWTSRRNWIVVAPTLAFILAVAVGSLSVWLLFALRRIERLIGGHSGTQAG